MDQDLNLDPLPAHVEWLCGCQQEIQQGVGARKARLLGTFEREALEDIDRLIESGSDLTAVDEDHLTALDIALQGGLPTAIIQKLMPMGFVIEPSVVAQLTQYLNTWGGLGLPSNPSLGHTLSQCEQDLDREDQAEWARLLLQLSAMEARQQLDGATRETSERAQRHTL